MAGPAPMDAVAGLGIMGHAIPHTGRLETGLDPKVADLEEPLFFRRYMHGHEVLVEERDEIDVEPVLHILHLPDHELRAMPADIAVVVEDHVAAVRLLLIRIFHVAGQPQMKAELADEGATVGHIDVQSPLRQHGFFRQENAGVLEVDVEGKQFVHRKRQAIDILEQRPFLIELDVALRITPDNALDV